MSDFRLEDHPVVFLKPRLSYPYAWVGHIPFAYLLIDLLRPRQVVELGTDSGNSYLAFCQAVQTLGSNTRLTAIDSWQGDPHARRYGEGVYETLKRYHDPRYAAFSRMHRSFFIDALGEFDDGSIDLLHIDGLHTYEAVSEDVKCATAALALPVSSTKFAVGTELLSSSTATAWVLPWSGRASLKLSLRSWMRSSSARRRCAASSTSSVIHS
jgi:hypothetical protein